MLIEESLHWKRKKKYRKNIENYMVEFAVNNSKHGRDRLYTNALNAKALIPQTGKTLKVVFRKIGEDRIKLITAFYID
ncbi:MAG TPA: hypothetical protein VFF09_04875 [archaeon]|nr:hypothetical protein [archaeon]